MKNWILKVRHWREKAVGLALAFMASSQALADLPTVAPPTTAPTDGNYLELIQYYGADMAVLAGLFIAAIAFFVVAKNTVAAYNDIPNGKSTHGTVGVMALVGVLILVAIIFLMNEVAGIL